MSIGLGGVCSTLSNPSGFVIWDEDRTDLHSGRYNWNYQQRGYQATRGTMPWRELWPGSRMCAGNPSTPLTTGCDGNEIAAGYGFEEWNAGEGGQQGYVYIRGQCLDQNSNPLASCTIEAYVTNPIVAQATNPNGPQSNVLAGTTTSDSNGNYACPSIYPGVAHYIVAYYAATNLAGTTVNTLIPTN